MFKFEEPITQGSVDRNHALLSVSSSSSVYPTVWDTITPFFLDSVLVLSVPQTELALVKKERAESPK
jgi:hypothetical protein